MIEKNSPEHFKGFQQVTFFVGREEGLGNLLVLRNILITYAAFHPGNKTESIHQKDYC